MFPEERKVDSIKFQCNLNFHEKSLSRDKELDLEYRELDVRRHYRNKKKKKGRKAKGNEKRVSIA